MSDENCPVNCPVVADSPSPDPESAEARFSDAARRLASSWVRAGRPVADGGSRAVVSATLMERLAEAAFLVFLVGRVVEVDWRDGTEDDPVWVGVRFEGVDPTKVSEGPRGIGTVVRAPDTEAWQAQLGRRVSFGMSPPWFRVPPE